MGAQEDPPDRAEEEAAHNKASVLRTLRIKMTAIILAILTCVLGVSTYVGYLRQRDHNLRVLSLISAQTGDVILATLQKDMLTSDFAEMQQVLDAVARDNRVGSIYLLDPNGRIVFGPSGRNVGQVLDNKGSSCQPCHSLPASQRPAGIVVRDTSNRNVFRSMHPVENEPACQRCHDATEPLVGVLMTDFLVAPVQSSLAAGLRENLLWWATTAVAVVIFVNLALDQMVLRRLHLLADALDELGGGRRLRPLDPGADDEIGRLSLAFNTMAQSIAERDEEKERLSTQLKQRTRQRGALLKRLLRAQEDERKRIARELHDDLGQQLGAATLALESMRRHFREDPDLAQAQIERAQGYIEEAANRTYDLIHGLRPAVLDDLGLVPALRAEGERLFDPVGVSFTLVADGLDGRRLPPDIETGLFRVSQEAMTNVLRHASATHVTWRIECGQDEIRLEIADNGQGFSPENGVKRAANHGFGLLSMRERLEQLGGRLHVQASIGNGTRISAILPLVRDEDGKDDQATDSG